MELDFQKIILWRKLSRILFNSIFFISLINSSFAFSSDHITKESHFKIISLKPNITEILFELGLRNQIVGVTQYCDYPKEAKSLPKVADFISVQIEQILAIQPTHIFGSKQNSNKKQIEFLISQNQNVILHDYYRLKAVENSILEIGEKTYTTQSALRIIDQMTSGFQTLNQKLTKKPRLLLVIQTQPLIVVGNENVIDDALLRVGLNNVARKFNQRYPQISPEHLIELSPEIIVDLDMGGKMSDTDKLHYYQRYSSISAVKKKNIFFLEASDFRPSPRILNGMKKLVDIIDQSH